LTNEAKLSNYCRVAAHPHRTDWNSLHPEGILGCTVHLH